MQRSQQSSGGGEKAYQGRMDDGERACLAQTGGMKNEVGKSDCSRRCLKKNLVSINDKHVTTLTHLRTTCCRRRQAIRTRAIQEIVWLSFALVGKMCAFYKSSISALALTQA